MINKKLLVIEEHVLRGGLGHELLLYKFNT